MRDRIQALVTRPFHTASARDSTRGISRSCRERAAANRSSIPRKKAVQRLGRFHNPRQTRHRSTQLKTTSRTNAAFAPSNRRNPGKSISRAIPRARNNELKIVNPIPCRMRRPPVFPIRDFFATSEVFFRCSCHRIRTCSN